MCYEDIDEALDDLSDEDLVDVLDERDIPLVFGHDLPSRFMVESLKELLQKKSPQEVEQIIRSHL